METDRPAGAGNDFGIDHPAQSAVWRAGCAPQEECVSRVMRAPFSHIGSLVGRLLRDRSGLALVEFAYSLPILMILGLGGVEVANYSVAHMRVSQIAVSLADNASRAKQEIVSGVPRMREYDVNETFL